MKAKEVARELNEKFKNNELSDEIVTSLLLDILNHAVDEFNCRLEILKKRMVRNI